MAEMNPYSLSDKAQELLYKRMVLRFGKMKSKLHRLGFDELNVVKETKTLYKALETDNESVFLELAQEKFKEEGGKNGKAIDRKWLVALLALADPVSKYIYLNEVGRKRERTEEAINASGAKTAEINKAMRLWAQMTAHYADVVTDKSTEEAYRERGVSLVRWVTMEDEKVCEVCGARDGKIYPIDRIPAKPHYGCRCWFVPVEKSK